MLRMTFMTSLLFFCLTTALIAALNPPAGFTFGDGGEDEGGAPVVNPPDPNATVPRGASRLSGTAPLYVFFNADLWESSPTEHRFHEYEYSWDFGDPASGTWGTTSLSKNTSKGAVAAHVFDTPGTYTVTLTVRDINGEIPSEGTTFTITVDDPDAVFSGTNTICVSDTAHNDFTGCPSGAQQITTDNLADFSSWVVSNRRVLLHRGSSWSHGAVIDPGSSENVRVGAYGNCVNPNELGICENAPHIDISTLDATGLFDKYNMHDWVIQDISISGITSKGGILTGASTDMVNIMLYRIKARNVETPFSWGHFLNSTYQTAPTNMAIVECDGKDTGSWVAYSGGENYAMLGCHLRDSIGYPGHEVGGHITRVWWMYKGVYQHNHISGANLTETRGNTNLKLHGPKEDTVGDYNSIGGGALPQNTRFSIVSNNVFGASGPWGIAIKQQDKLKDERLYDIIIEKNKLFQDYGRHGLSNWRVGMIIHGSNITIRNNIIDATYTGGNLSSFRGITIGYGDVAPNSTYVNVYNNTIYSYGNDLRDTVTGIEVTEWVDSATIRNNYVSYPGHVNSVPIVIDISGSATHDHNVYTDIPGFVNPNITDPLLRDYHLSTSTEAINKGYSVPVLEDFDGNQRTGSADIGAYSF